MTDVRFLTLAEVSLIHQDQVTRYGGSFGLRDSSLLGSAIAMPESSFSGDYLHKDLFQMASAYLFHICQNHPFIDGNKRAGLASSLVFLDLNGLSIDATDDELYDLVIGVATGALKKNDISEFFKEKSISS